MRASVQYGDFKGTSAADISDHQSLEEAARRVGIDTGRFKPVGMRFFSGTGGFFTCSIISIDKNSSTDDAPYLVEHSPKMSLDQFFGLFKRLDVVLLARGTDFEDVEAKDTIHMD